MWTSEKNMEGDESAVVPRRAPNLRIKQLFPLQVEHSVLCRAVAQVEVDPALVGNFDLFRDFFEVGN